MPTAQHSESTSKKWWIISICSLLGIAILGWYLMSGYGEISSDAYQYARSLYTVCNQKDLQRLEKVEAMIESDHKSQKINDRDHDYLMGLVEMARDGNWAKAQEEIRVLLEAQIKS